MRKERINVSYLTTTPSDPHSFRMSEARVPAPGSTASLRPANQRRVVDVIRGSGGEAITQAEVARATGLAAATVSNIVRELTAAGIVETDPGAGRRGTVVRLARSAGLVGAVDFGHTHVAVALADLAGELLGERRADIAQDHEHRDGLALAKELLEQILEEAGEALPALRGLTIGLPAPIHDDVVQSPAILPGWIGVNARTAGELVFHVPVHIDNDANLGALAEHRLGAARDKTNAVFVKVSSGVGAGLIINGQLFRGSHGTAGEVGHMTIDEQGPLCRCGSRGCLEVYTSTGALTSMLAPQWPGASVAQAVQAAHDGNVAAQRLFEDAGLHLGWGLAALANVVNPDVIIVGGDMAAAGDMLFEPARVALRRHALTDVGSTPVVGSTFGSRAPLIGGVLLAVERTDLVAQA